MENILEDRSLDLLHSISGMGHSSSLSDRMYLIYEEHDIGPPTLFVKSFLRTARNYKWGSHTASLCYRRARLCDILEKKRCTMKIILDTADVKEIERLYDIYPISGVTTNPSILSKEEKDPYEVLREIRNVIGPDDLHVQTLSRKAADIVEEAKSIVRILGLDVYVKIPVNEEGIRAIRVLSSLGIRTTGTAIFTVNQAYLAAASGASYLAPYVNRIENTGADGPGTVMRIQETLRINGLDTKVVAASFKNVRQVEILAHSGVDAVTLPPSILAEMCKHPGTEDAIDRFEKDFSKLGLENMNR